MKLLRANWVIGYTIVYRFHLGMVTTTQVIAKASRLSGWKENWNPHLSLEFSDAKYMK